MLSKNNTFSFKYQSSTFKKKILKLVLKIIIGDYDFNFKLKIVIIDYDFKLKKIKTEVINYNFNFKKI